MLYRFYVSLLVLSLALCLFAQEGEEKKETKTHTRLVVLDLAGSYPEHSAVEGLENQTSLHQLLELIYACKDDAQVDGLILKVSGVGMGYGKLTAVIQALRQFRTTGKPIYCFLESAMTQHYLLAAQASRLSLYPTGEIFIPGVAMQMVFMKGLLEMLGVEADFITQGKYKAAAEAMTRESSSPESREANEAMLDDFYEGLLEEIASARKLSKSDAKQVINGGMFSGKEALAAKLVDHCEYPDEFEAALQASHPLPIKKITDYKKKKRPELNTNNPFALFQVLSQILNPQKKKESKNPKIAILYASGGISSGKAPAPSFFGSTEGIYSDDLVKEIRSLRDNETVKAVVFRIDSGGGSALASDVIHREIELLKAKKPVIASMSDVAASGGYYIAAPCDLIFAEKLTITGSIGVLGGKMVLKKAYEKLGLNMETLARGRYAELFSSDRKWNTQERQLIDTYMSKVYDDFVMVVAKGRKMSPYDVHKVAQGRVWTGKAALEKGLVDQLGGVTDALTKARELAKLEGVSDVEIKAYPEPRSFFDLLAEGFNFAQIQEKTLYAHIPQEFHALLKRVAFLKNLTKEHFFYVLPYQIEIK